MRLLLLRTLRIPDGVFGEMRAINGSTFACVTCEDDWRDNAPRISCIPAGIYQLRRSFYHKGGYEAFQVMGVPGRSRILIHKGNVEENLDGCIAVGMRRGTLLVPLDEDTGAANVTKQAVLASAEAYRRFMEAMVDVDEADLEIVWVGGLGPLPLTENPQ